MIQSSISAAVLIGGRSRRMGMPKALLRLADNDPTLIERTAATLHQVAAEVVLVGTPSWLLPDSLAEWPLVADHGTSAADGVVTALESAKRRFCIVVACDMPFLDSRLLREMASAAVREGRGMVAADARGWHPLHAVWDRERLPELRAAVDRDQRSLGALARLTGMATIDLDAPGRTDRERWSAFNVNTPEDLEVARARAGATR
jgi:molybdenum cofactor guanylyltransferase